MSELQQYPVIYSQVVAWGDMDAFGHVNNVIYYRYIESARLAYLNQLNVFDEDILTVVASNQCRYLKPVVYPDQLKIAVRIDELRHSAIRMHYLLWSEVQQCIVATSEAVIVCLNKHTLQKTVIPPTIREKIIQLESSVGHII
ncbi:acyl-CoA thioesterase [Acinetobacter bohemicus]|uniref:acyl-CoA thioesterase n=1 Tax=Acinetobacter TaxID=469 RepID=UPI0011954500|nr:MULTISPECIES: thioesterase family protein [Acinetobacter]MCO8043308.1 acyl-CoA thioesterase [Acinetobacter sp. S4400-12]MCU7225591.1 acyl-CoA thioesterase [Acinetobacter bohemicus]TSH71269.1 acyl-CoA thioesterase [Acinetobacter sp. RF15A]TSI16321.1 acyl-CoA thioesterase [Acinetobacter sp. RF15B]